MSNVINRCIRHHTSAAAAAGHPTLSQQRFVKMPMVQLKYKDIPTFLHAGEFYRNLDGDDAEDTIEIPTDCFQSCGDKVQNLDELSQLIRTMIFWALDAIPYGVLAFCRDNDVSYWQDTVWYAVHEVGSDLFKSLQAYQFRGEVPVADIVKSGRQEIVMHLLPLLNRNGTATTQAAKLGDVRILQLIHLEGFVWHKDTCSVASGAGHLDCLQYAHENGCPWDSRVYAAAAKGGSVKCIEYALVQGLPWHTDMCTYAAQYAHLDCLQFAHENSCPWSAEVVRAASSSGAVHCLRYALQQGCPVHNAACTAASQHGHLRCLQFLHQYDAPWDTETFASAAWHADIACLQYLRENGCPVDESAASVAASAGHVRALDYILESGCPFDDTLMYDAVKSGHLQCLQYLVEEQLLPVDGLVFLIALLSGDTEFCRYLVDIGCAYINTCLPIDDEWQMEELDVIFKTNNPDFLVCLQFAVERGWQFNADFVYFVCSRDDYCADFMKKEGWIPDDDCAMDCDT